MCSCEGSQLGDLLAVMGMEMTESAFLHLITNNVGFLAPMPRVQNHLKLNVEESI